MYNKTFSLHIYTRHTHTCCVFGVAVRYAWCVVWYAWCVVWYAWCVVWYAWCVVWYAWCVVWYAWCVVWYAWCVVGYAWCVVWYAWCVVWYAWCVVWYLVCICVVCSVRIWKHVLHYILIIRVTIMNQFTISSHQLDIGHEGGTGQV